MSGQRVRKTQIDAVSYSFGLCPNWNWIRTSFRAVGLVLQELWLMSLIGSGEQEDHALEKGPRQLWHLNYRKTKVSTHTSCSSSQQG